MNQLVAITLIVLSASLSVSAFPNLAGPLGGLANGLAGKIQLSDLGSSLWLGRCPVTTELEGGFNVNKYLGNWYEIKRTGLIFEFGQRCVKANYQLDQDGNVAVNNSGVNLVNFEVYSLGTAKQGTQSNVLAVSFFPLSPTSQYWIVDTDYDQYSLVVSCNDIFGLFNIKDAWILSRTPTLDSKIVDRLTTKLESLGISSALLSTTKQDCGN